MNDEVKEMMDATNCPKCNSEEIDVVNSFSEKVTIECRDCEHVEVVFGSEEQE